MENNDNSTIDLTLIDNVRIEVEKSYWVRHKPSGGKWERVTITRITDLGHPWKVGNLSNGILTDSYEVQEMTPQNELEQFAREWLDSKGYGGFANHTPIPKWFAEMYNDFRSEL